jgi:hypothetical protein
MNKIKDNKSYLIVFLSVVFISFLILDTTDSALPQRTTVLAQFTGSPRDALTYDRVLRACTLFSRNEINNTI